MLGSVSVKIMQPSPLSQRRHCESRFFNLGDKQPGRAAHAGFDRLRTQCGAADQLQRADCANIHLRCDPEQGSACSSSYSKGALFLITPHQSSSHECPSFPFSDSNRDANASIAGYGLFSSSAMANCYHESFPSSLRNNNIRSLNNNSRGSVSNKPLLASSCCTKAGALFDAEQARSTILRLLNSRSPARSFERYGKEPFSSEGLSHPLMSGTVSTNGGKVSSRFIKMNSSEKNVVGCIHKSSSSSALCNMYPELPFSGLESMEKKYEGPIINRADDPTTYLKQLLSLRKQSPEKSKNYDDDNSTIDYYCNTKFSQPALSQQESSTLETPEGLFLCNTASISNSLTTYLAAVLKETPEGCCPSVASATTSVGSSTSSHSDYKLLDDASSSGSERQQLPQSCDQGSPQAKHYSLNTYDNNCNEFHPVVYKLFQNAAAMNNAGKETDVTAPLLFPVATSFSSPALALPISTLRGERANLNITQDDEKNNHLVTPKHYPRKTGSMTASPLRRSLIEKNKQELPSRNYRFNTNVCNGDCDALSMKYLTAISTTSPPVAVFSSSSSSSSSVVRSLPLSAYGPRFANPCFMRSPEPADVPVPFGLISLSRASSS